MSRSNIISALTTVLALSLVGVVYATPYSGLVTGSAQEEGAEDPVADECPSPGDDGSGSGDDGSDACAEERPVGCDSIGSAGEGGDPAEGSEGDPPDAECDPDEHDGSKDPHEGGADDGPTEDRGAENHGHVVRVAAHCAVSGRLHGHVVRSIARDKYATIADAEAACEQAIIESADDNPRTGKPDKPAKGDQPATAHRQKAKAHPVEGPESATPKGDGGEDGEGSPGPGHGSNGNGAAEGHDKK